MRRATSIIPGVAPVRGYRFKRIATSDDIVPLDERVNTNAENIEALNEQETTNRQSLVDLGTRLTDSEMFPSAQVATATQYQAALNNQRGQAESLIIEITVAISGTRAGTAYAWPAGQILHIPPTSDTVEPWFILPQGSDTPDVDLSVYP